MINENYYQKLAQVESSNNPLAKNPKSSAKGKFQFIDGTAKQYGLDKYEFGTPEYTKAEETAVRQLSSDNFNHLKTKLGREPTNGELYLAHQQGAGGAEKILSAPEEERAVNILGMDQVKLNGGDENMTVAEFKQKWTSKFNDLDAQEQGLTGDEGDETLIGEQGQDNLEVDAFSDFGVNLGNEDIDAFADFGMSQEDEFLLSNNAGELKKSMIDQKSGAPSYIRQVVGSLYDEESRLETLRKYYPDAQPYGEGNFVFTNPETNKPTLYNPKGLDTGDAASITKELFVTVGSGMGAVLGGGAGLLASAPTAGVASPVTTTAGAMAGAGIGAGISANLFDAWMTLTGQTQDVRTFQEVATETTGEVIGSSLGEGIGRAIPSVAKNAIGGAKSTSRAIVAQFDRLGITPTMTATGGATSGRIEAGLAQNVMSAEIMQKQADKVVDESYTALQGIIKKYGKPKTKQGAGAVIYDAAEKSVERIGKTTTDLYEKAYNLVGENSRVRPDAVRELYDSLSNELLKAPETRKKTYTPALNMLKSILVDEKNVGIDFRTLRAIRTDIGRDLADPLSSGATSSQNLAMKRVYAALSDDMGRSAINAGEQAATAIKRADKYKKAYETTAAKTLTKILKYDAEEKAYKFALSASKDGGTSLTKLRKLFTPDEWDDVSATVLNQLGEAPVSGDFSIARFVTNYNKLAPEAKNAFFKGGRYKEAAQSLDDFVGLMETLKDAGRYTNTSNTAGAMQFNMMLQNMGMLAAQGAGGAYAGEQTGIGSYAGAAGAIVAPRLAAKLITNSDFVRWMAKPVTEGAVNMSAHLTRLIAIGEANPELKESINELINAMNESTKK